MSAKKTSLFINLLLMTALANAEVKPAAANQEAEEPDTAVSSLSYDAIAQELGWVTNNENYCNGYYLEQPFVYPINDKNKSTVEINSDNGLFSKSGTSSLQGKVSILRAGQQITSNNAYLYRDPLTAKLTSIEMIGNVHLREPNSLIIGKRGKYNFQTKSKSFSDILYRTSLSGRQIIGPHVAKAQATRLRKVTGLTAWGKADEFSQTESRVYEMQTASFSTCTPTHPAWQVKASHIVLNKNTGRGYATNARIYVKDVPVFYFPYINFSIDNQRKTGFLWPTAGVSNTWGPYFLAPFYLNLAPNYDMTITPGVLSKRGIQWTDNFRYLDSLGLGTLDVSIIPHDQYFADFQKSAAGNLEYVNSPDPTTRAELSRLLNDSTTRKSFFWRDDSRFNDNWSSHIDYNYASDDYYYRDFGSNLNEITANYLLQEGDLFYQSQHWNFTGRLQAYQTLHPIDEVSVPNQYRRFPQLVLSADYPDQALGLEYFINNEITHFEYSQTPGVTTAAPIGNRFHMQPGISLPLSWSGFYVDPRLQVDLTDYNLYQTTNSSTPNNIKRSLPIFDVASGLTLTRESSILGHGYQQTLEPQVYYTYIPYRDQSDIPLFDTTVNTLTYDQIFNYNRFSGIDRIGDANQIGVGITTRFIDQETGIEKVRLGVGEIIYFANRLVTLCNDNSCTDNPDNHSNYQRLSPISGLLNFNIIPMWTLNVNSIWNPVSKQLDNSTFGLSYIRDDKHVVNLGYSFARGGDVLSGVVDTGSDNNLKVTDLSFAWPLTENVRAMGRWSQNWNHQHLQNLLYGVQYDTCCWAVQVVGGRAFTGFDTANNNRPTYNKQFYIQVSLKGIGNIGNGNPSGFLSSINGYNSQFGQDI